MNVTKNSMLANMYVIDWKGSTKKLDLAIVEVICTETKVDEMCFSGYFLCKV